MTIDIRAIRENEKEECIALWRAVWPGDNDAYFRRYFEGDVEWLPYYTQVAIADGRLVSAVHICKRTVACGPFKLTMGGIANVATLPEYRGKGLNTACLSQAVAVMEADAMDFSLLFTGINDYYARLGYSTLSASRLRAVIKSHHPPTPSSFAVRDLLPDDLPALFGLYDQYNVERPIAVQRTPAYWRDWIGVNPGHLDAGGTRVVACDAEANMVGYAAYQANFYHGHQINEDYAYIVEYASVDDDRADEIAKALLLEVAHRAQAAGKRELHLSVPLEQSITSALQEICERPTENVTDSGMVRLLHRDNLLTAFLMALNERWIAGGRPNGELWFETPYGPVGLIASGRFLKTVTEPSDQANIGLTLPQSALVCLLLGREIALETEIDASQKALISVLFPQRPGIYWSADGF